MYLSHFNLSETPFSIAPNPRYLYLSQRHQEALAHLLYGVHGDGGFVLLTGEIGAGKTTVCRCLLEQIPANCDVAYIFNPKLSVTELLSTICLEFGIDCPADNTSIKVFVDVINAYLLDAHAKGRSSVLIIDEAQNLAPDVLEQMRLLTNLETDQRKLLQIILIGQPELATLLERPGLSQLAQRIVARYHLDPLSKGEVAAYVQHRLAISGTQRQLIPPALMGLLYRLSGGVPRVINVLCDRALLGAFTQGKDQVDRTTLLQAARETLNRPKKEWRTPAALAGGVVLAALTAWGASSLLVLRQAPTIDVQALQPGPKQQRAATTPDGGPAAVPTATPLGWPAEVPAARSKALAYAALFQAWGISRGDDRQDACRQARRADLTCHTGQGNVDTLRALNRPAILPMRDREGREFHIALTALELGGARYVAGGRQATMSYADLAANWSGRYEVLLRLPPEARQKIRPGDHGPAVRWLRQQLGRLPGHQAAMSPADSDDQAFDAALEQQVKDFQRAQGLRPDGRAGGQTLQRLCNLIDQSGPRLLGANISAPGEH